MLNPLPQECVGNTRASVEVQTEARLIEVEESSPINRKNDDSEWKVVVPKGRRSYANVVKHEKATEVTFSRK
jgi:hypothetical protein